MEDVPMRKILMLLVVMSFGLSAGEKVDPDKNKDEAYLEVDKGKVYIRSHPEGAVVKYVYRLKQKPVSFKPNGVLGKTPCMIALPLGHHMLKLEKPTYVDALVKVDITDTSIQKLDRIRLRNAMCRVDVIFMEEGWEIYVDGKPYREKGKTVTAPATIKVTHAEHVIEIRKGNKSRSMKTPAFDGVVVDLSKTRVRLNWRKPTKTAGWAGIEGKMLTVQAKEVLNTNVVLRRGQKIKIYPCETDTWKAMEKYAPVNYKGMDRKDESGVPYMSLMYRIGRVTKPVVSGAVIIGEGTIYLYALDPRSANNVGYIRVKIVGP
jgi:hypothetical protein